ncbi:hypothetical protein JOL79_11680 [Microbispora sp. RL4-1S]|uniref:Uncharacterized protein n=1 Tax=Microbispora oryzae TaxID=2806554 RepID=A0A940WN43_9ACTN|nr:hypothetical protein [Microbispora oryzae]MBP2704475.1 hypothetical protein [Microbispora oryzae]
MNAVTVLVPGLHLLDADVYAQAGLSRLFAELREYDRQADEAALTL